MARAGSLAPRVRLVRSRARIGLAILAVAGAAGTVRPLRAQEAPAAAPTGSLVPVEVLALRDAEVYAEVAGRVVERPEDDTRAVAEGAVVVRLDDELARAEAEAARGLAEQADAQRAWAETEFRRARDLLAAGSVEKARFDEAEAALRRAAAAATAAGASARLAEARLARTRIRAPFAGRLVHVYPETGEYLASGQRAFRVVDDASLRLVCYVPAALATRLAAGQACRLVPEPAEERAPERTGPVRGASEEHGSGVPGAEEAAGAAGGAGPAGAREGPVPLPELPATVFSVAPAAEGASRTFRVEARVAAEALEAPGARRWRPGMTALLRFGEAR